MEAVDTPNVLEFLVINQIDESSVVQARIKTQHTDIYVFKTGFLNKCPVLCHRRELAEVTLMADRLTGRIHLSDLSQLCLTLVFRPGNHEYVESLRSKLLAKI